jgi:Raf kinase inhibitor-like YbhB/YbcL family protein
MVRKEQQAFVHHRSEEVPMRIRLTRGCATLAAVVLAGAGLVAQQGGGAARGGGGGAPQGPPMMITSTVLTDMGNLPAKYSCAGNPANVSPSLSWSNAPAGTQSFVILVHDLEPRPNKGIEDNLHWLVWNIPATATSLAEGVQPVATLPDGSMQVVAAGRAGGPPTGYRGPCPPPGQPHHYPFEVFALDSKLDSVGAGATRADVMNAMNGHVVGHAVLMTKFDRQP